MSIYAQRQIQRQQNFLAGRSRSAYRLPLPLEQSRVQESTVVPASSASSSHAHRTPSCKRGCPQVLSSLKAAFDASGLHPAKQHQKRVASYPIPKQKLAHRNIRGKTVIITAIIMHKTNTMILHSTPHTQCHTHTHTHETHTHTTHTHTHTHNTKNTQHTRKTHTHETNTYTPTKQTHTHTDNTNAS